MVYAWGRCASAGEKISMKILVLVGELKLAISESATKGTKENRASLVGGPYHLIVLTVMENSLRINLSVVRTFHCFEVLVMQVHLPTLFAQELLKICVNPFKYESQPWSCILRLSSD